MWFKVGRASLGGCSLQKHWNLAAYAETHPDFKPYQLAEGDDGVPVKANLQDALAAEQWDVITLHRVSACRWRRENL